MNSLSLANSHRSHSTPQPFEVRSLRQIALIDHQGLQWQGRVVTRTKDVAKLGNLKETGYITAELTPSCTPYSSLRYDIHLRSGGS